MVNTNINWTSMSDQAIVEAIGSYLKHQRLNQNKTQAQIAEAAGVNRWTISQIEKGEAISLTSLIQILRALDALHVFSNFKIEHQISPLELAKLEKQKRQRARNKNTNPQTDSEW